MKFRIAAVTVLITLFCGTGNSIVNAEPLEFIFEHYSSDDGMPHNSICDIYQDRRGYLWLCTWYGLSRYDGNDFVNYTPGDYSNLCHNRILSAEEDSNGYLWITTYDYHLYRFDVNEEQFISVPGELKGISVPNRKVDRFMCAGDGSVWIAVSGTGMLRVFPDMTYKAYFSEFSVGKEITGIYEDSDKTIYVLSETGITMFIDGEPSLISRDSDAFAFAEYAGYACFASPNQLLLVDMSTHEQKKLSFSGLGAGAATTMSLTGRDSDMLYVGFRDNAVAYLDPVTHEFTVHGTDMGRVRFLFPDPEGLLWIATERTGIWSFDKDKSRFKHYEHSNNVMSYYVDTLARVESQGDRVWIKMNNWGFGYYDRCCDEIVPLKNVKEQKDHRYMNGVACFETDATGVLWMSTVGRGLEKVTVIKPKVSKIVPPTRSDDVKSSSEVRAMLRDSRDNIWVATKSRELYLYSPDLSRCRRFPDRNSGDIGVIYSIFEDRDGNIWLGSKGDGLIRMSPSGDDWTFKRFKADSNDDNTLSSNNIYSIEQDNDGRIWIGTYGGALSMLPTSDSDEFITADNNFPDYPLEMGERVRYLHCMDDGRMLVATVGGLIMFEPSDTPELTVFH